MNSDTPCCSGWASGPQGRTTRSKGLGGITVSRAAPDCAVRANKVQTAIGRRAYDGMEQRICSPSANREGCGDCGGTAGTREAQDVVSLVCLLAVSSPRSVALSDTAVISGANALL